MPRIRTDPLDAWAVPAKAPLLSKASALALAVCAVGLLYLLTG